MSRRNLNYPDSFERYAPFGEMSHGRSKTNEDGQFRQRLRFNAKNAFGMESRHIAYIMVNEADCSFDYSTFMVAEDR